jgi:Plasmid pRiA4b ORF-3-like protein
MSANTQPGVVYQLRVVLRQISPLIWRRLLVAETSTITDLHYTLQIAFNWSDFHLHRFRIQGKDYGLWHPGGMSFRDDPNQVHLADFHFRHSERFRYEYDFGDLWQHDIRVEAQQPSDPHATYPICLGGARAAPSEDCGGPQHFLALRQHYSLPTIVDRLLEILEGDADERVDALEEVQQFQYWLMVDRFDRRAVNRRLRQYALQDAAWQWEP